MQNTTADYKLEINKPSRSFECKITIGDNIYTNEDLVNLTLEYIQPQEGFSIGGTISQSLDLTLLNNGDIIYSTSQIKVEIGLKIDSKIEYILMGIFNIDEIEKTDYTTKFTAYDNMMKFETAYFSELGNKPTLKQVVTELEKKTGLEFTGSLPDYTVSKLDGFSCREILSYVASICGGNAFITRDGKFTIKSLSEAEKAIDGNNYFNYKREEVKYKIGQVSCQVDGNNILSKGSIGTDSMELAFENPWITEIILTEIYNKLKSVEYLGYSMKWQGDLSLDPYDIITVTDVKNVVRNIPILSQKITYTGGLTSEIGAKGETKNKNSFSSSGSTTNKVDRLVIEQAVIKDVLIDKANIKDLEASNAKIENLEVKIAKIEEAYIKDLNALNANIENLIASNAIINNAVINKADITELNAVKATIKVLEVDTANIKNLLAGNITGENIQAGGITSDKLTIANGFITNAMIANLDVAKINAGNISTNKFRIVSDSGKMLIADNTIQIRDNNRVRVQIGKDASNDYSMYVWDSTGKLMFDATGLKADGIKDSIIRDDMISDDANIDGSKIDINSLVTEINKDTNTTVIKSTKIQIDSLKQTLDVAFNSLKSNVDNIEIGGRNIATETNRGVTGWGWGLQSGGKTISEVTENGIRCCKMVRDNTAATGWSYISYSRIGRNKYIAGRTYTVSFEVKSSVPTSFLCHFLEGNSSNGMHIAGAKATVSEINKWTKLVFTITMKDTLPSSTSQVLYLNSMDSRTGVTYIFRNLMIEEGTKASAWTPAPEDINNSIDAVKQVTESNSTTINVMQGQISTAINNTQIVKDGKTILLKDDYNRTVAKVDSINSIIGSQTTKLDQLTGSIASVDSKVNSVQRDLEGTKSTVSNHTSQINGLNSTVSTQSSSISQLKNQIALKVEQTDINNAINNVQVGVRNLVKNSSTLNNSFGQLGAFRGTRTILDDSTAKCGKVVKVECTTAGTGFYCSLWSGDDSCIGKKYTWSFYAKMNKDKTLNNIGHERGGGTTIAVTTEWKKFTYTWIYSSSGNRGFIFYPNFVVGDILYIKDLKIEEGTKATDWTPAIEDVNNSIANVDSKVTTTSNKVAAIEVNLGSITQRVSSTESTANATNNKIAAIETNLNSITSKVSSTESKVTTINGNITNLQSRINTAEQKITPTAITSTISSTITGGTGSISTTQFVMDKNGLTIKNGALTIKNKSGVIVLNSDTNGNLIVTGTLKSQSGEQFVSMNSGGIDFQDWHRKEQMLRIGISYFNSNRDMNGINFALARYGDFIRFSHIAKTDLTNGWSSSDTQYTFFDCWSSDQTVGGISYKKGINIYSPMYIGDRIKFKYAGSTTYTNDILSASWNGVTGLLGVYGDNGAILGYQNSSNLQARIVVTEAAHPGTGDHIKSWGNWNCSGSTVHNATFSGRFVNSYANLTARTFIKTNCIEAENKQIRINFKDIQLKNGKAILNIPNRYMHINTGYIISSIVKKGKGDVWIAEELENRFIIEGSEDIKINIEIIVHLEDESLYTSTAKTVDDQQLCIDMSTGQPIGA